VKNETMFNVKEMLHCVQHDRGNVQHDKKVEYRTPVILSVFVILSEAKNLKKLKTKSEK
jgi:hypothetical protein